MGVMKTNEAPGKLNTALTEPEIGARPDRGTDWAGLAWLSFLVAVVLTVFATIGALLFPSVALLAASGR